LGVESVDSRSVLSSLRAISSGMKPARTLMVQGTASSVGKSLMVTALCRLFHRRGVKVAPFKSQNMALNSFVTPRGEEIGRAQAVQAEAAGAAPMAEMNPILLKPEAAMRSQVVIMGRPAGSMTFLEYHQRKSELSRLITECLARLREQFELVIIEGAGSPAEINLNSCDIVNMHVAAAAEAPVILVGDIDRGGLFAQIVGTMELLAPEDRRRIAAFLINKFRGDAGLLKPGLDFLTQRYGVPVIGVVPFLANLAIADEDSVSLEERRGRRADSSQLDLAVVRLPHISNYDDFLALEHEPGVIVRFIEEARDVGPADLLVIPGSKSTVDDLGWMRRIGIGDAIVERAKKERPVIGICGGCQMLGMTIEDPDHVESPVGFARSLGLLPIRTRFQALKRTAQVKARVAAASILSGGAILDGELSAYEIHMGRIESEGAPAAFRVVSRNGLAAESDDGAVSENGMVAGTMLHGIFDNDAIRETMLKRLRIRKGLSADSSFRTFSREAEYDRLADVVEASIDMAELKRIVGRTR
jgi:adenosylcobyric acid synthase